MVGIGGFAGSALRYAISRAMLPLAAMSHFPWHSLLVLPGCDRILRRIRHFLDVFA